MDAEEGMCVLELVRACCTHIAGSLTPPPLALPSEAVREDDEYMGLESLAGAWRGGGGGAGGGGPENA